MRISLLFLLAILSKDTNASYGDTFSSSTKLPITLDISEPLNEKIIDLMDAEFPNDHHYLVKQEYLAGHRIGKVVDGSLLILEDSTRNTQREVFVLPYQDGTTYVKILSSYEMNGESVHHVDELIKKPEDGHYAPIVRRPLEIDVLTQCINDKVNIKLVGDLEQHDKTPGIIPENLWTLPLKFTIQPDRGFEVMIGMVRYGRYILEYRVDGLMSREVIWEGGLEKPFITITSKYNDGTWIKREYTFVGGENKLLVYNTRRGHTYVQG